MLILELILLTPVDRHKSSKKLDSIKNPRIGLIKSKRAKFVLTDRVKIKKNWIILIKPALLHLLKSGPNLNIIHILKAYARGPIIIIRSPTIT